MLPNKKITLQKKLRNQKSYLLIISFAEIRGWKERPFRKLETMAKATK
jgi:hypothetical protein